MPLIAFHASHEQFPPSLLLRLAIAAEQAGFDAIHSSDHFHPWSQRQGQSGLSFSWLGAAMQATSIPFSMVCAPGQRYHPAIVAQGIATLAEMFPGRFTIELGSGEAINECITGDPWPSKKERNSRLLEAVGMISKLLDGKTVTASGYIQVKDAKLFTRPRNKPLLLGAAISKETAAWIGGWGDGLITTGDKIETAREKLDAFRTNGGMGKPVYLQVSFSYAQTREAAVEGAYDQWRSNLLSPEQLADIPTTEQFDELATNISREEVAESIETFTCMEELMDWIEPFNKLDIERIILHNIHPDQEFFIREYASYKLQLS